MSISSFTERLTCYEKVATAMKLLFCSSEKPWMPFVMNVSLFLLEHIGGTAEKNLRSGDESDGKRGKEWDWEERR